MPFGDFCGGGSGVPVLFVVRPVAIAIFKVDAKILDRFAPKFLVNTVVDRVCQPGRFILPAHALRIGLEVGDELGIVVQRIGQLLRTGQLEGLGETQKIGRKLVQRSAGQRAEPSCRIGFEKVSAAIDRMDRLPTSGFAGIARRKVVV